MCSTTSWFFPRRFCSSVSCSRMPAMRLSSIGPRARDELADLGLRRRAYDAPLGRNQLPGQRRLELRHAAPGQQHVVAVDLRQQRLLRRHRKDLRRRNHQQLRAGADLTRDFSLDLVRGSKVVPQSVDLVQDDQPAFAARGGVPDQVLGPHVDVGLGHSGVGGEDEQDRVCIRQQVERELGLGADGVQAGRVENDQPLLQQRMRKVDDRVAPAGHVDTGVGSRQRRQRVAVIVEPVLARKRHRDALGLRHLRERFGHPIRRRHVERDRHPFVRVVLELGDRSVAGPGLDRQQADRRLPRRVVEELGRTHRRAAGGRGQQALPEIGKEDRVDQLRFAAGKLGDEGDDQLVLVQPLEQALDGEVGLAIGQFLLGQPFMQARHAGRQPASPVAVGFKSGSQILRLHHFRRVLPLAPSDCSIKRAKTST